MIQYLTLSDHQPRIQGYYAVVSDISYTHINKQSIVLDLLCTGSSLKIFVLEIIKPMLIKTYDSFEKKMVEVGWKINSQMIAYNEHSDMVNGDVKIIIGTWNTLVPEDTILRTNVLPSPQLPVSFGSIIEQTFNDPRYVILYIGTHFHETQP